jgi:hypothetical protein
MARSEVSDESFFPDTNLEMAGCIQMRGIGDCMLSTHQDSCTALLLHCMIHLKLNPISIRRCLDSCTLTMAVRGVSAQHQLRTNPKRSSLGKEAPHPLALLLAFYIACQPFVLLCSSGTRLVSTPQIHCSKLN